MKKTNNLAKQAMIAALYTVIGFVLAPVSFGAVQARISEALTLLPVFGISNVWGVTIGCFLTNLIGLATGANILGSLDIIFGTAATLVAGLLTYALRNIRFKGMPVLASLPPVIINAVVVGWELCIMINGSFHPVIFTAQAVSVALGQIISCCIFGLMLVRVIEGNKLLKEKMVK
ncbi:MAG: QueT transporter family protein [Oscillospiraceae bacterium]|nr:QueT transporter family protein [Oscillospiraceae bacterium]